MGALPWWNASSKRSKWSVPESSWYRYVPRHSGRSWLGSMSGITSVGRTQPWEEGRQTNSTSASGRPIAVRASSLVLFGLGRPLVPYLRCWSRASREYESNWRYASSMDASICRSWPSDGPRKDPLDQLSPSKADDLRRTLPRPASGCFLKRHVLPCRPVRSRKWPLYPHFQGRKSFTMHTGISPDQGAPLHTAGKRATARSTPAIHDLNMADLREIACDGECAKPRRPQSAGAD